MPARGAAFRRLFALAGLAAGTLAALGQAAERFAGPFEAQLIAVIDGDTLRARVRVWLDIDVERLVRLDGIDAPELRGRCEAEGALARRARDRLAALTAGGRLALYDVQYGKYAGRVVARIEAEGRDLGRILVAEGLARPYDGGGRESWCGAAQ